MEWDPKCWELCQVRKAECLSKYWIKENVVPLIEYFLSQKNPDAIGGYVYRTPAPGWVKNYVAVKIEWRGVEIMASGGKL